MEQLGVDVARVSPQPFHTEQILALFRQTGRQYVRS